MREANANLHIRMTPEDKTNYMELSKDYGYNGSDFFFAMFDYMRAKRPVLKIRPATKPYRTGKRTGVGKGEGVEASLEERAAERARLMRLAEQGVTE